MLADLRPRWVAYLLALCITALVLLGREAVAGFLGRSDPFLPFVGAVLIASWFGGLGPGLLATALGAMVTDFFLVAPFFSLPFAKLVHGADLLLFVVLGVLISLLSDKRLRLVCQLWEADCRKNRFLATLAHELRNPLAPIANAVQCLRLHEPSNPQNRKSIEIIERQTCQITRLVDDLLDISRISHDKLELRTEPTELASVVQSAVETARPIIQRQGHDLTIRLPDASVLLKADPVRLGQVFANLLNNAAKFTPPGGRIEISAEAQADEIVVAVRDSGIGIPLGERSRIFEIFAQGGRCEAGTPCGLGIGLALARRLVEMHGGSIDVTSEGVGRGSEFKVRLPAGEMPLLPNRPSSSDDRARPPRTRYRILIADDNKDSVESLGFLLSDLGNEVHKAYDGMEAVMCAQKIRPEVVLMDIGMPVLDGYAAARRIRSRAWGTEIVLVAVTGWGQDEDRKRSERAGFDYHLTKPIHLSGLCTLLETLAARKPTAVRDSDADSINQCCRR